MSVRNIAKSIQDIMRQDSGVDGRLRCHQLWLCGHRRNVQGTTFVGQNYEFPLADYGGYGPGNIGSMVQTICGLDPAACIY